MKAILKQCIPGALHPPLKDLYWKFRRLFHNPKSRAELHAYWRQPDDEANSPEGYLKERPRSDFLISILNNVSLQKHSKLLELGCNVGRNLNALLEAGYNDLTGIEINSGAVEILRRNYQTLAAKAQIINEPVEDVVKKLPTSHFDVVYTMAVLEHIRFDSEWIFAEMGRITKDFIITIEDERGVSWRHFPRNYRMIFEDLGLQQVWERQLTGEEGLPPGFVARVLRKD